MSGRIRGVVGQFLRSPRAVAKVTPCRPQPLLYVAAFNVKHINQRSYYTSLIDTHRSFSSEQSHSCRFFSSQATILEEEDDAMDMNRDPLFVHVYPGSRVLEMALPYDSMKMKQIDAMIRSTQPPVIPRHRSSLSVEGCNVLSPALVTSMQAQLEGLCSNASVRTMLCSNTFVSLNAYM